MQIVLPYPLVLLGYSFGTTSVFKTKISKMNNISNRYELAQAKRGLIIIFETLGRDISLIADFRVRPDYRYDSVFSRVESKMFCCFTSGLRWQRPFLSLSLQRATGYPSITRKLPE